MIDLHMHLNGSLSADTIVYLAKKYNIELPTYDVTELKKLVSVPIDCESLNDYLKCTKVPRLVTQTSEGISEAITLLLDELKNQGLIYAEIRFAPQRHRDTGLTQEEVVVAALEGLKKGSIKAKLVLCCMRGDNILEQNLETVRIAKKYLSSGVGGIDLAGAEAMYKTENFADVFAYANELGVPFTIHAGEADGSQSVKTALDFGAKRIGHGVRSLQDKKLVQRIIDENITLELCPTSNFQTKTVQSVEEYPLREFLDLGVKVTLNTDNKTISNTNLNDEYNFAKAKLGLKEEEKLLLYRNAIEASFTSKEEKQELYKLLNEKLK